MLFTPTNDSVRGLKRPHFNYINPPRNRLNSKHTIPLFACVPVLSELYWT